MIPKAFGQFTLSGGFWIFAFGWLFLLFSTVTNFIIKVMRKEEWTMPGQERATE